MDSFVYIWTDHRTEQQKQYIGVHKGLPNDKYISSSKPFNIEYEKEPENFTRQILAFGTWEEMAKFEHKLLKHIDAANNINFYNESNSQESWFLMSPEAIERKNQALRGRKLSEENKRKIGLANSISLKGHKISQETIDKRRKTRAGYRHSQETIEKIRMAQKGRPLTEEHKAALRGLDRKSRKSKI